MKAKALFTFTIIITIIAADPFMPHESFEAAPGGIAVRRTFYLTNFGTLGSDQPQPGPAVATVLNQTSLYFELQSPLGNQITLHSPFEFRLWLEANNTTPISLEGSFFEKFGSSAIYNITSSTSRTVPGTGRNLINFTYALPVPPSGQPLVQAAQIGIRLRLPNPPTSTNVTLFYGADDSPSHVVIPLSNYLTLDSKGVEILNGNGELSTSFDLNSTNPANVVIFQASVRSAFGVLDVKRVNLTIFDPFQRAVRGATNLTMAVITSQDTPPFVFTTVWTFPSNATEGGYTVFVSLIDIQDSLAFSQVVPTTFTLFRGLFLPPPFNLLPYAAVGGVTALAGLFYYKRRKSKSYLVPFDHFHTLTGGELDSGSIVAVEGNTGSGKTLLSEQMMFEDLKKGRPCVFVATADFPSNIRQSMKDMGMDVSGYESSGLLTIVDGYSSEAGQESREKFSIPSLADLTTAGIKITSSLPSGSFKGGSLYLDSLIPLASKARPDSIVSFVQSLGARVKGMAGKAFFTVGPSVEAAVQRQLEDMADCVIQMEAFEEGGVRKSRLRIAKYRARRHQQSWVIYSIEEGKGIIFYSKKPRR